MLAYSDACRVVAEQLRHDADAHDAGRHDEIGRRFDGVERDLPRGAEPELRNLHLAVIFWDAWIDARNRGWQGSGPSSAWPTCARAVAANLIADHDVDESARPCCATAGNRAQALALRLRTPA
jgi:hypothetical protein